jgi:maltooligosyltrehalose trehalohydrolase
VTPPWELQFGATVQPSGVQFRIWAPRLRSVQVAIGDDESQVLAMYPEKDGEFAVFGEGLRAGADYTFLVDGGRRRPDPVSRWQPRGVHAPSRVVDHTSFAWSDKDWRGIPLEDYIIYELHTGTFTSEGTFEALIPRLADLRDLGVTAIELMPVAEFPGRRNWGYDGVGMYAPQSTYGGPDGLKTLVNACHSTGLAVVLDVVYNHLGPEGNYLGEFAPYYTNSYRSPWGDAINYDGAGSDGVRRFFVDNALYWLTEYHVDALRLDAIHGIFDCGARHILEEIAGAFHAQADRLGRSAWLIAESDLNDPRVIEPRTRGGHGIDAQWLDDFHHSLHTALTGEHRGFFADFDGLPSLRKAIVDGFVYDGQHSRCRGRRHGSSSKGRPGKRFVAFTQNHDQIANALQGVRSSKVLTLAQQKLAAAVLFFSPYLPLLFMGQEYGETAEFLYFTEHGDQSLIDAMREGRRMETGDFLGGGEFVDPQDLGTFQRSKLNWGLRQEAPHSGLLAWYRDWIAIRKQQAALRNCRKSMVRAQCDSQSRWLAIERRDLSGSRALLVCNFSEAARTVQIPFGNVPWSICLWSGSECYGPPAPQPAARIPANQPYPIEMAGASAALYLGFIGPKRGVSGRPCG